MRMLKTINTSVKLKIKTKEFWILVAIYVGLLFLMEAPATFPADTPSLLYMVIHYSKEEMMQFGEMLSSYSVVIEIRSFKWYVILLPVLSAYMGALTFEANYVNGIYQYAVPRTTRKKYAFASLVEAAIYCVGINLIAILLFTGIVYLLFPSVADFGLTQDESMVAFFYGATSQLRFLRYIRMIASILLVSLLNTEIMIIGVILFQDVFFGLSIPMVFTYLGFMLINLQQTKLINLYGFEYPMSKLRIQVLNSAYLIDMENSFTEMFSVSQWLFYVGFLLMIILIGFLEVVWIARRKKFG